MRSLGNVLVVLCSVGCFYQIISLATSFFSHAVISETQLVNPTELDLPDVTICFDLSYITDFRKLLKKYSDFGKEVCDPRMKLTQRIICLINRTKHINIEILKKLRSYELHDYLIKPELLFPEIFSKRVANKSCPIEQHSMWQYMCYHISCGKVTILTNQSGLSLIDPNLMEINVNRSLLNMQQPIICSVSILPYGSRYSVLLDDSSININLPKLADDELNIILVKYERTYQYLLPSPYPSKCKNYNKRKLLVDCLNNISIEKRGSIFNGAYISGNRYSQLNVSLHTGLEPFVDSMIDLCANKYNSVECYSVKYSTIFASQYIHPAPSNGTVKIVIKRPEKFDTVINERPLMPRQQFSVMILSTLSSWFGISILQCATYLARLAFGIDLKGHSDDVYPIRNQANRV